MDMGVSVTDRAAERIKALVAAEKKDGQGLRLKVVGGGCSGLQYRMDLDNQRPGDRVIEKNGAKILVDMKSLLYLNGTELDYKEELMQSGFVFQNPNVKRSCGCGTSVGVEFPTIGWMRGEALERSANE
jgi:iron-sulfur cluster assembly protein